MTTILIVDDQPANREYLGELLRLDGYTVLTASDGTDALARMATCTPDLVITDVAMLPMNGYQLIAVMQAEPALAHIKVIVSTAMYPLAKVHELAASYGVAHVLGIPTDPAVVVQTVRAVLAGTNVAPLSPSVHAIIDRLTDVITDLKLTLKKMY